MRKVTIVNIGSFSWMLAQGGMPGYTTSKSAIMGLTRTLARDLGEYNIRVNCYSHLRFYLISLCFYPVKQSPQIR